MQWNTSRAWLRGAWAALTAGSRAIPLGDNGALFRELAGRIAVPDRRLEFQPPQTAPSRRA